MKTKRILVLCLVLAFIGKLNAQQLDYSAQTIKLIPDKTFLANTDWKSVFYDETKKDIPSKVGINKVVKVAPDGSIFISDRMKFTITKLDNNGKVVKSFGKKGGKPGEFASNQDFEGIFNDNLLVVSDCQGRINFFDLDGNFVKMITIDFMPLSIKPTQNGKLIIWGHVPYGTKSKSLLAELDYESEEYTQIYYTFTSYDDPKAGISVPYKEGLLSIGPPFSARRNMFCVTEEGKIIFSVNNSDDVLIFTKINGSYNKSVFNIEVNPIAVTEAEKEEYYQNFKERLEKYDIDPAYADKVKEKGFFPTHLPYYYNLIVDDQSNCLFFIYSNEDKDHIFQAYSIDGKFLGESEFKIDGYDLMSKLGHFKFKDGYVYTLALKHNEEAPLRILKCKVISE